MVVPLQLTVAINPGPALATRDKLGMERFEGVVAALAAWAQALPADTPDDMSLVTLSGPIISHASARDWLVSLQAFRPDFRDTTPNLQTLQIAIQTVAVQAPRVGMKRAVFFITPHMDDPDIDALMAPLIELAMQNNVRVFVWFTDTELYAATASAMAFQQPRRADRRRLLRGHRAAALPGSGVVLCPAASAVRAPIPVGSHASAASTP